VVSNGGLPGVAAKVTQELSSAQHKPVLDEGSFQQLLAAAYVVQAHNDRLVVRKRKPDGTHTLSEIAETQRLVQTQQLGLQAATQLIAERLQQITNASGIAIGIVEGDELVYRAATGSAAGEAGSRGPLDSSLSANCLNSGQILQCSNVKKDSVLSAELCRERGVKSLVAAPVYHKGKVAGVLELRFAKINAFVEHDVRTSQLMAGLVTEAIAGEAELEWKQELAAERASMLEVLDRIKPQLERLVADPEPATAPRSEAAPSAAPVDPFEPPVVSTGELPKMESTDALCPGCGHRFEEGEFFCGICGAARLDKTSGGHIESKWASLLQQAAERREKESSFQEPEVADDLPNETARPLPAALEKIVAQLADQAKQEEQRSPVVEREASVPESTPIQATATPASLRSLDEILARFSTPETSATVAESDLTKNEADSATDAEISRQKSPIEASTLSGIAQTSVWTSAIKARAGLESLKAPQPGWAEFWGRHRANIYLGIAALILQIVILLLVFPGEGAQPAPSGNSVRSSNAASAVKDQMRKNPSQANLTLFEKLLVSLGLAEPPSMPVYLGNPSIQVWVDLHTALYYCPGSDLYGKTPGGKFTSQRDAQQDQFEPANRKACD
jgi:putative methionine-R-sulfoxide reductase with GAF domain